MELILKLLCSLNSPIKNIKITKIISVKIILFLFLKIRENNSWFINSKNLVKKILLKFIILLLYYNLQGLLKDKEKIVIS